MGAQPVLVHNANANGICNDFRSKSTQDYEYNYNTEGAARNVARKIVGPNPIKRPDNKLRSQNGKWQYRAKPNDIKGHYGGKGHVHIEELDPKTGEVLRNIHLYFNKPRGQ
jgi:hypothetical protein